MITETSWSIQAQQHWDRALAKWPELGFHSKCFYLSVHLKNEAKRKNTPISGAEAYLLARQAVEEERIGNELKIPAI